MNALKSATLVDALNYRRKYTRDVLYRLHCLKPAQTNLFLCSAINSTQYPPRPRQNEEEKKSPLFWRHPYQSFAALNISALLSALIQSVARRETFFVEDTSHDLVMVTAVYKERRVSLYTCFLFRTT